MKYCSTGSCEADYRLTSAEMAGLLRYLVVHHQKQLIAFNVTMSAAQPLGRTFEGYSAVGTNHDCVKPASLVFAAGNGNHEVVVPLDRIRWVQPNMGTRSRFWLDTNVAKADNLPVGAKVVAPRGILSYQLPKQPTMRKWDTYYEQLVVDMPRSGLGKGSSA